MLAVLVLNASSSKLSRRVAIMSAHAPPATHVQLSLLPSTEQQNDYHAVEVCRGTETEHHSHPSPWTLYPSHLIHTTYVPFPTVSHQWMSTL